MIAENTQIKFTIIVRIFFYLIFGHQFTLSMISIIINNNNKTREWVIILELCCILLIDNLHYYVCAYTLYSIFNFNYVFRRFFLSLLTLLVLLFLFFFILILWCCYSIYTFCGLFIQIFSLLLNSCFYVTHGPKLETILYTLSHTYTMAIFVCCVRNETKKNIFCHKSMYQIYIHSHSLNTKQIDKQIHANVICVWIDCNSNCFFSLLFLYFYFMFQSPRYQFCENVMPKSAWLCRYVIVVDDWCFCFYFWYCCCCCCCCFWCLSAPKLKLSAVCVE